jgi:integrase
LNEKYSGRPNIRPERRDLGAAAQAGHRDMTPSTRSQKSWREVIKIHPAADLFPLMSPEELRVLGNDIKANGMHQPPVFAKVQDFNPDGGTLHVRTSKSGQGRQVVLNDEGVEFFSSLTAGRLGSETMLRKADTTLWGKSHQARPMIETCARAKISPAASFHALRHTYASHVVMAGAPLLVVAKNLGHADTRMVEKHYGHLSQSYLADAIRAAAPRFGIVDEGNVARLQGAR